MPDGRRCKSRHRKCWIICDGHWLWCWECGAIRGKREKCWTYPVGSGGENPAMVAIRKDWGLEQKETRYA